MKTYRRQLKSIHSHNFVVQKWIELKWGELSSAKVSHFWVLIWDEILFRKHNVSTLTWLEMTVFLIAISFFTSHLACHTRTHTHRTSNVTFYIEWIIFTKDSIVFVIIYDSTDKWPSVCASGWCEVTRLCSHFNMWITILPMKHGVFILTKSDRSMSIRSIGQHFYTQSAFHIDIYMKWT